MMRFHFPCLALCEIELWDDGEGGFELDLSPVTIHGFFQSRKEMAPYVRAGALHDKAISDSHQRKWGPGIRIKVHERHYVVVPMEGIAADSMEGMRDKIEDAAKLLFQGCCPERAA